LPRFKRVFNLTKKPAPSCSSAIENSLDHASVSVAHMAKRSNVSRAPGNVRVIAGEWRGRRIAIPDGTAVRPTPDRVRETLFNWLRELVEGAHCLDLFAGTGVLGFEALSRGAAEVWFVEQDAKLVAALQTTAATFGVQPQIVRRDVLAFLREPAPRRFDIAFLDPPYALEVEPLLELLEASSGRASRGCRASCAANGASAVTRGPSSSACSVSTPRSNDRMRCRGYNASRLLMKALRP
jgi:16S rRNA (guanine966-N2)-methyltransferase